MAVGTTRAKRRLGRHVRPIMDRAGLKPAELAKLVRTSRDTVDRMLTGANLPRYPTLVAMLTLMKATEAEIAEGTALWERASKDAVVVAHAATLPPSYLRFRMDEGEAIHERTLDQQIVPGLLQLGGYAEALGERARALTAGEGWTAQAAAERRDRQTLLDRADFRLHALVDEAALHRVVGGRELMAAQLDHLRVVAAQDNVTIQVIPFGARAYGLHFAALTLLSYPEPDEPLSAYVEEHSGIRPVDDVDVDGLAAAWDDAAKLALNPEQSAKLIEEVRDTRYAA
ncbi:helix-turn-helix domain-containing protein [Saccharothrix sp. Mg75]|uniref:helix-turn-helix domain-containing protein n=1 Tax=Saccharothrix sp. Mg75 TaxID=3445357 RepID=UPI003EED885C